MSSTPIWTGSAGPWTTMPVRPSAGPGPGRRFRRPGRAAEMEFAEVVRRRRMVRDYDPDRPLPAGLLDRLVDVALRAPSAGFTQGVSFLILSEARDRDRFWSATTDGGAPDGWLRGMRNAPGLILVLTSAEAYLDRYA